MAISSYGALASQECLDWAIGELGASQAAACARQRMWHAGTVDSCVTVPGATHFPIASARGLLHWLALAACLRYTILNTSARRINQMTPQRLGGDKVFGDRLVQVSMQKNHCCAVTEKGSVFTWGDGAAGRLGHGDQESKLKPKQIPKETFAGAPVLMVTGGERHSVALTVDGRLWIWGWRCSGRLGLGYLDGPEDENRYVPTPLPMANFPSNVVMIAAGEAHTLALTHMGDVFTWGSGAGWRLGFDDNADRHVPVLLQERSNFESRVLSISAGSHHNMAVTTEGKLWAWGDSEFGQVGLGERRRCKPTPLNPNTKTKMNLRWLAARAFGRKGKSKPFDGARVVMAACGYFHTLALTDTGSVWAWGRNCDGALGVHDDLHR